MKYDEIVMYNKNSKLQLLYRDIVLHKFKDKTRVWKSCEINTQRLI